MPTAATSSLLNCQNVTIQRGEFPLCEAVNLVLNRGDICHLVGENGTGKTTFLMQLAGLIPVLTILCGAPIGYSFATHR